MTDNVGARLAALEAAGWTLVLKREGRLEPVPGHPGVFQQVSGSYRLERMWRGSTVSEIGETLEQAVEAARWQQERIESLEDKATPITDGVGSSNNYRGGI
jgi:hypothetical protein